MMWHLGPGRHICQLEMWFKMLPSQQPHHLTLELADLLLGL